MLNTIKVGFLVSYDYEFLKHSLPIVYPYADEIYLAADIEGKTWAGNDLHIDEGFWKWVQKVDVQNKIHIYKDNFYIPGFTAMECDTRERNMLGKAMGIGGWHVQIDADEYFVDFEGFSNKLREFQPCKPTSVFCSVATLFKKLPGGFLTIGESLETLSFATNHAVYDAARDNRSGNEIVKWNDFLVLHQSWAREESEITLKLNNWSHRSDFNTNSLLNLWKAIDENNYYGLRNFHPLHADIWPKLVYIEGNIETILQSLRDSSSGRLKDFIRKKRKNLLSRLWREIKSTKI